MERVMTSIPRTSVTEVIVILLIGSLSSIMIFPSKQTVYAHVFTGDESASFMSVIKMLQSEANLVQSNLVSNVSLAQDHAKAVVDVVNGNHTFGILPDEVSENNRRVATDVIHSANALQAAVKAQPTPTHAELKTKVDNLNATLQEAVAVRLPKEAASNSTVNGLATKDLVNETLRQYSYAFGVAKSGDPSSSGTVMNMSAYQSAEAMASQAEKMLSQAKSVIPANATATTKAAIVKLATDLSQLKSSIHAKDPYEKVATLVMKTIYPDLDAAFRLK